LDKIIESQHKLTETSIIHRDLLIKFAEKLEKKAEIHSKKFGNEVVELITRVEKRYAENVEKILSILDNDLNLQIDSNTLKEETYNYLNNMRWVGWGNCQLGPPLMLNPIDEYSYAIIIYLSARLIDDAIDGHVHFKNFMKTLYGYLVTKVVEREAAGLCTMMGNMVYQNSLKNLIKENYIESANILIQLYSEIIPGALMESFVKGNADINLYEKIIKRKSVKYDMMLNKIYFRTLEPSLRDFMIELLSEFSETAQWLNDLMDYEDDKSRNQLNILNNFEINMYSLYGKIANSFDNIWLKTGILNKDLQNAMAARLIDPVNKLIGYKINF
jgi:hypothetical protein